MGRVPRNIIANVVGQGWTAAMTLLLVPVYVRVLGVEAYGLIGVYATLQASLLILDLGLGQTTNRVMAQSLAFPDSASSARDFLRTVEIAYWAIGTAAGAVIAGAAPLVARRWLRAGVLPIEVVEHAVRMMGLVVALQWPLSFYAGAMMGQQRQVFLNVLRVATATLTGVGTVGVLWAVSATVTAYFAWQAIAAAISVALFAIALWRSLPGAGRPARFRPKVVVEHWRFAAGMGGIAATGVVLSQMDKLLLSKMLPLETFGYYTLAGVVASAVPVLLAGPVFSAIFPRLTTLSAAGATPELSALYHSGTQLMAVLVSSVGGVVAVFSSEIMLLWTGSATTAAATAPIVTVLVVGMATNALMVLPYALQLAHGWVGIGLRINLALIAFFVPAVVVLASRFGPVGAAWAWVFLNVIYMAVGAPLTHRRLLRGALGTWFGRDILPPLGAAALVLALARAFVQPHGRSLLAVATLGGVLVTALAAAAAAAPRLRRAVAENLARLGAAEER